MRIAKGSLVKLICIGLVLILALCALPFTFSWLCDSLKTIPAFTSYVHKSYFESGDGTAAKQFQIYDSTGAAIDPETGDPITPASSETGCAFEIKYPVQLYYFAWLQYLGYFNQPKENAGAEIDQVYFYLSSDLDMTGWTLPPIGTEVYPFVGNFDGNGHTISNLTIQNVETGHDSSPTTLNDFPIADNDDFTGVDIIGFFGVVGAINENGMVYAATDHTSDMFDHSDSESYIYSPQINEIKNFALDSVTVKTETTRSLIGIVAGYVNGEVSQVRVGTSGNVIKTGNNVSAVTTLTDNLSDYTLMGYVTNPYKDTSDVVLVKLDTPSNEADMSFNYQSQGSTAGWGGSIDMYGLLKRLDAVRRITESSDNLRDRQTIPRTELLVIDPLTGNEETTVVEYYDSDSFKGDANNTYTVNGDNKLYYFKTLKGGSYHITPRDSDNRNRNYLIGLNTMYNNTTTQQGKTVYTVTLSENEYLSAYDYYVVGNYLNLNANKDGLAGGNQANYHWVLDNGSLYTVTDTYDKIYLNATDTISVSNTATTTTWTWSNNRLHYTYNGLTYSLQYDNGWIVTEETYYVITDGHGNYLTYNGSFGNTRNPYDATHWTFTNANNNTVYISTGNTYLRYNNGLTTTGTTNRTQWTINGTSIYYQANNNTRYYLRFNGTNWVAGTPGTYYAIRSGNDYLNVTDVNGDTAILGTGTSIADFSSINGHTLWSGSSGTISTLINGQLYYLRDDNGTLTATTANNPTSWSNTNNAIYTGNEYIRLVDGEWVMKTYPIYAIRNTNNGNIYLNLTGAGTIGTGNSTAIDTANNHTYWTFSNPGNNPSGTISTKYNSTTYYLFNNNGTLAISTDSSYASVWTNDGSHIYSNGYYLNYSNNAWVLSPVGNTISSGNNYLNLTGAGTFGTANSVASITYNNRTGWMIDVNEDHAFIYASYNGSTYYLYYYAQNDEYVLGLTTDLSLATSWEYDGSSIHVGNYYVVYDNGWKIVLNEQSFLGYTIDYNGNYLNLTSTSTTTNNPIGTGANVADTVYNGHTVWTFENTGEYPSGRMSVTINQTRYYLYGYSQTTWGIFTNYYLRIATNPSNNYNWTNTNGRLVVYERNIRWNNGWQYSDTNSNNILNFTPVYDSTYNVSLTIASGAAPNAYVTAGTTPTLTVTTETEPAPSTMRELIYYQLEDLNRTPINNVRAFTKDNGVMKPSGIPVYIPLTTTGKALDFINYRTGDNTDIFDVATGNTGYITSGAYDISDNRRGDVRISAYNITNINRSFTMNNGWSNVYTIDGFAGSYTRRSIDLSTGSCNGKVFSNFKTSLAQLTQTLQSTGSEQYPSVYGIHFMQAQISMDHIITIPYANVDGNEYTDYELPEDAIDFSVHQKGLITFYAGTYHSGSNNTGNDSMFSLHKIDRTDNKIDSIHEIQYIFSSGVEKDPYIYMYTDNTFSDGNTHAISQDHDFYIGDKHYTMVFNCEWLWTDPRIVTPGQPDVYYFEIPVNRGEYALGSVRGGTGAYLIYLDIAANSQLVDRATVIENFEEVTRTYEFPVGATFQNTDFPANFEGVVIPSAVASLTTSAASSYVTVTDDQQTGMTTVNFTTGTIGYVKEGVVANGLTYDSTSLTPVAPTPITKKIRRTTYYDYNVALDRYTVTEVLVWQINNGDKQMTINAWNTGSDWDINSSDADKIASMTADEAFVPLPNANVENVVINTEVSNTFERVVPEGAAANSSEHYFLIRVDSAADAQTLRINPDAFEGDLEIAEELYSFSFGIRDYDDSDNGAAIVYVLSADVFTFDSTLESDWYTISGFSYDVKVETYETIEIHEIEDNSSSIDVDVTVTVAEPASNVVEP